MNEPVLTQVLSRTQIRAKLEAMVVGNLLNPAGGEREESIDRDVRRPITPAIDSVNPPRDPRLRKKRVVERAENIQDILNTFDLGRGQGLGVQVGQEGAVRESV